MLWTPAHNTVWTPGDAPTPAGLWVDTTLPGGVVQYTGTRGRALRDWSGNHKDPEQMMIAQMGSMVLTGPGGAIAMLLTPGAATAWQYLGSMGAAPDHAIVVGLNITAVPGPALNMVSGISGGNWISLGTDHHLLGIHDGAWHLSNLSVLPGVHAYSAVIDGATATAWLYVDGVRAAATVACAASNFTTRFTIGSGGFACAAGSFFRCAYWNSKVSDATLAKTQECAVLAP
jgi:hypothetical protein